MSQALMIVDLWFSDGTGPLRASGRSSWELLKSVGMEKARDNDIYIKDCIWIAYSGHNEQEATQKAPVQPKRPKVSSKEQKRLTRAEEAWYKQ